MDFEVTFQQGGFIEFEETGIYPRHILFYSRKLKRNWRFKMIGETQSGVLKLNKISAYRYVFSTDLSCKIQAIGEGDSEWYEPEYIVNEMRD